MNASPLRVLVFGASGQVGGLLQKGDWPGVRVQALTRVEADFSRPETLGAALERAAGDGIDAVINAAAYTAVDQAETETDLAYAVNRDGPGALAAACAGLGVPLLHLSTDYVFDGGGEDPHPIDAPIRPLNVYGSSKAAGEQAVRDALSHHLIVRTSWVFAAEGRNFVRTMLRVGEARDHLRVVADQHGGPTPASAIADMLIVLARRVVAEGGGWGTYHYAGAPETSWYGFAQAIFAERWRLTGRQPPVLEAIQTADYHTPARRPLNSRLDMEPIRAIFGIAPPDWRPALAQAVAAFLAPVG